MGHQNMRYTGPIIDLEMDQQDQHPFHPEPCVFYGSMPIFPQPNSQTVFPVAGNGTNFDVPHLSEHHGAASYGMAQYNVVQHQYLAGSIDLGASSASNPYPMYNTPPSGTTIFPPPLNHGSCEQFQLSSNLEIAGANSYGRNNHFMDATGGSFKRKNAEGFSINFQYCYASAGSSSSDVPLNVRPIESDDTSMDAVSFAVPDGRGNDMSYLINVGSHRGVRNRSGAIGLNTLLPHSNHFSQGHYPGRPFHSAGTPWMDTGSASDIGSLSWNQLHALPYRHGSFNGGCVDNMGVQGYQVASSNRNSATFLLPPPLSHGHLNLHYAPPGAPTMQGARGNSIDLNSQVATSSRQLSTSNSLHTSMNPFQGCEDAGSRFVGPTPPTGLQIYRPHRRELIIDPIMRQRNLPHLRILPEDGFSLMELSEYHGIGDSLDHHRDMRLDIDHMSYEELLALGEQIGSVGSGLSEEFITSHLKLKTFALSPSCSDMEDTASVDQELLSCVICQSEYDDQEIMGRLDCGHEYHSECIKKWLLVKNTCPICKSAALTVERKES